MAYAKHQSFYLKQNWVNKGIKALNEDPKALVNVENYFQLGIGKNMLQSLRYWLEAFNIVEPFQGGHKLTPFGEYINSSDLSCKLPFTVNLMQFFLSRKDPENGVDKSHGFYWFFNVHEEKIFKKQVLVDEMANWDSLTFHRNTSQKTLGREVDCLIQTYTKHEKVHPEDKNVSVLAQLGLVQKFGDSYVKTSVRRAMLDYDALYFIILRLIEIMPEYANQTDDVLVDLDTLANCDSSPCKIFGISRIELIDIFEVMNNKGYMIEIVRTNNLDTVLIRKKASAQDILSVVMGRNERQ